MKRKFLCKTLSIISVCAIILSTFGICGSIFADSVNRADGLGLQELLENSDFLVDNTIEKEDIDKAVEKLTLPDKFKVGQAVSFYKMKAIAGAYEIGSEKEGGSTYKGAPKQDTVLVEGIDGYVSAEIPVTYNGENYGTTVVTLKIEAPMKSYSFRSCTNNINDWVGNNAEGWKLLQTAVAEKIVVPDEITNLKQNWLSWNSKALCVVYGQGITTIPRTDSLSKVEVVSFKGEVKTLKNLAFYNWQALKYIRIPDTVKKIDAMAFKHCASMDNLYLPEGLEFLGVELFYSPREDNLNHDPEKNDNKIGELNYDWAYKISEITIPSTVQDIYSAAFIGAGVDCDITVLTHSNKWAYDIFYHQDMDQSMGKHIYLRAFGDDGIYKSAYSVNEKEKLDDVMTISEVSSRVARQAGIEGDKKFDDIDTVKKSASKMLINMENSFGGNSKYSIDWNGEWAEIDSKAVNTVVITDDNTTATVKVEIPLNVDTNDSDEIKISNRTTSASLKKDLTAKYQGSKIEILDFYLQESMPMVYEIGSTYPGAVDGEVLVKGKKGYVSAIYTVENSEKQKIEYSLLEEIAPEKVEKTYATISNDIGHWIGDNSKGYRFNNVYKAQKVVIPDQITKLDSSTDYLQWENAIECLVVGTGISTLSRSVAQRTIDTVSFKGNNVKTIGTYAFHSWVSLKYIQLPDSVETINKEAFRYCSALEYLYIPTGIKTINSNLFYVPSEDNKADGTLDYSKGYNIRSITVPATAESISDYAFIGAATDCEITFLTKKNNLSLKICYGNEWDESLGKHIFIRGFEEDASYKNQSVNEKVNLTEQMSVCEAAVRAAIANEKVSGDICENADDAKSKEVAIKAQLTKAYGELSSITAKWKNEEWVIDGFIVKNSLALTRNDKTVEIPVKMYLEGDYNLQEIALQSGVKVSNSTNSVTLIETLKEIVLPGGYKADRILDFYKIDAIEGAMEIGSTYKGAVDGEILVPGEKGYISAVVLSSNAKGNTRKDTILLEIAPDMAEYSFETVSNEKDFTYNSANWGQRWEYHPMSGICAEKIVVPDKVTEVKSDWHQSYTYKDFKNTVRCIVYNEHITSIPGVYWFDSLQVVSFKGNLETLGVHIPGGNTSNYSGAFEECRQLRHIRLPDTVKTIGGRAFKGCVSLKYLYIPESVEVIGEEAFYASSDYSEHYITNFTIPSSVKTIGKKAFVGSNLSTTITVLTNASQDDKNGIHTQAFYSDANTNASNRNTVRVIEGSGAASDNVVTAQDKKILIKDSMSLAEAAARAAQKVAKTTDTVGTVEEIENIIKSSYGDVNDFTESWETQVWKENGDYFENYWTLSYDGATFRVKFSAKLEYSNIQAVVDGITLKLDNSITQNTFKEIFEKELPGGYYINQIVQYYKIDSIPSVKDVSGDLNEILVDGSIGAVTAIINIIRADGKNETVTVQQKIDYETKEFTFASVSEEKDFLIENGKLIKYSGDAEKIVIPEGVTSLSNEWLSGIEAKKEDYTKQDSTIRCIVYPQSLKGTIPAQPRLAALEVVSFKGDKVTELSEEAFYKAQSLEYIQLPGGLKTIGKKALATGHRTRSSAVVLNVKLPDGLKKIEDYAFYWDDSIARNDALQVIEEIVIPQSVTYVGEYAFANPNILGSSSKPFRETFKITFLNKDLDYSENMLALATSNKADIVVSAYSSSGVYKELNGKSGYEVINLDSMTLAQAAARAIVKVDDYEKAEYPSDISPDEVEKEIVKSYGSCDEFTYSWKNSWDTSTDTKRYGTFYISDGEYTIGVKIALKVPPIYTLNDLVKSVEQILKKAEFSNTDTEKSYKEYIEKKIPGKYKVQIIDYNMQRALDGAKDNTGVLVNGRQGSIASIVRVTDYYGNYKDVLVESVVIPSLKKYSFKNVSKKTDFILSDDGTVLLEYYGTAEKLVVPEGVVRIANNWMWKNPANIKALVLPESLKIIPNNLCDGMISLEVVSMKDNVISVGANAFAGCYSLKYIDISDNLEEISENMFKNTYSLMDIYIPKSAKKIGANAFTGSSLRNITIPESVIKIGENAFSKMLRYASDIGGNDFTIKDAVRNSVIDWVEKNNISDVPVTLTFMGKDISLDVSEKTLNNQIKNPEYKPDYFAIKAGVTPKFVIRTYENTAINNEVKRLVNNNGTENYDLQVLDMGLLESVARANTVARSLILYNGINGNQLIDSVTSAFESAKVSETVKWVNGVKIKNATQNNIGSANGTLEFTSFDGDYSFRVEINNRPIIYKRPELNSSDSLEDFWGDDLWNEDFEDEFEDEFNDDFGDDFVDDFSDEFDEDIFDEEGSEEVIEEPDDENSQTGTESNSNEKPNKKPTSSNEKYDFPWIWILIGGVAVLLICSGTIFTLILIKKKKLQKG